MTNHTKTPKHRLFIEGWSEPCIKLKSDQSHYLTHVLRLNIGTEILIFDGANRCHRTLLSQDNDKNMQLELAQALPMPEQDLHLHVALPIPKGERADWAVEKLTELGVHEILWWQAKRSVMKNPGMQKKERWKRLTQSAARQSFSGPPPHLSGPHRLDKILENPYDKRFIALPSASPKANDITTEKSVLLLLGPEGGFSPEEEERALDAGCQPLWLGRGILRIETAALVAVAHLQNIAQKF